MGRATAIGTSQGETPLVNWLKENGFPEARREVKHGRNDQGDVHTEDVCWEVKAGKQTDKAGDGQLANWLTETETERVNSGKEIGVLVLKRAGYGPKRVGQWHAVIPVTTLNRLFAQEDNAHPSEQMQSPIIMHVETLVSLLMRARSLRPLPPEHMESAPVWLKPVEPVVTWTRALPAPARPVRPPVPSRPTLAVQPAPVATSRPSEAQEVRPAGAMDARAARRARIERARARL